MLEFPAVGLMDQTAAFTSAVPLRTKRECCHIILVLGHSIQGWLVMVPDLLKCQILPKAAQATCIQRVTMNMTAMTV